MKNSQKRRSAWVLGEKSTGVEAPARRGERVEANAHGIEGAFLSHDRLSEMTFEGPEGERVEVSTLNSRAAHSIFRVRRTSS